MRGSSASPIASALVAQMSRQTLGRARRQPCRVDEALRPASAAPSASRRLPDDFHQRARGELRQVAR